MVGSGAAMHHTIIAVDVEGFGALARTMPHQLGARAGLYKVVKEAFGVAGVSWGRCQVEDRADAVFILVPPDIPKGPLVEVVPEALARAVRAHNRTSPEQQRVRLRMAVHAGEVTHDDYGVTATAVTTTFRLLDAPPLKQALADSAAVVALIVSRWVFDEVVRHSVVPDGATFRSVTVSVKEALDTAWIALPDQPYSADPTVLHQPDDRTTRRAMPLRRPPASSVERQLRLLATASRNQWAAAAKDLRLLHPAPLPIRWRRATAPVVGPVSAATYERFEPLPGLTAVSDSELREGDGAALHRIYGALPSGRLLLIGPPGSGKSTAATLLLLDALRDREQATPDEQALIPVPVLFPLHGWDVTRGESVVDWMVGKLVETYPMFHGSAGRRVATDLLTAGRVAGFLDGLDEIPESARSGVLEALADAPFRLVLLTRTAEAIAAAHHGPLAGAVAVELQPVRPTDAAAYLLEPLVNPPPDPWKAISNQLQEAGPLAEALSTPLALSLLRDVYGPSDPVDELLDTDRFPSAAAIENHLLDYAITAAYTPRPGHPRPRYSVATAERTLRYLATQLTEHHTRDLAWWHIPTWTSHGYRVITAAATNFLANGLIYGLTVGLVFGSALGLSAGLTFGLSTLFVALAGQRRGQPTMPKRIVRPTRTSTARSLVFGLLSGLSGGLLAGLAAGLMFGLASGLASVGLRGIARHTEVDGSSLGPADLWRHDRNSGLVCTLVVGLVIGLVAILTVMLIPGLASRPSVVLTVGLVVGLVVGLGAMLARRAGNTTHLPDFAFVETTLAAVRLTIRHKTPVRLIAFLEDARSKHLLRTVGPVYQFRHAALQARLAQPDPELDGTDVVREPEHHSDLDHRAAVRWPTGHTSEHSGVYQAARDVHIDVPVSEWERFLEASLPARAPQRADISLVVRVTTDRSQSATASTVLAGLRVEEGGTAVTVVVQAPAGLRSDSLLQQTIHVPENGDSLPVRFAFHTRDLGVHRVQVTAWSGGSFLAELGLEVSVQAGGPYQDIHPRRTELRSLDATPGEVTLMVGSDGQRYLFQLLSDSCMFEPVVAEALSTQPGAAVERTLDTLKRLAEGRGPYAGDTARRWMTETGIGLWNDTVPELIKEQFWQVRTQVTSFSIATTYDVLPWELLYPLSPTHNEGFLIEQFPVLRRVLGQRRTQQLSIHPCSYITSSRAPANAKQEIDTLRRLLGDGPVVDDLEALLTLLDSGDCGLLHFACHNSYTGDDGSSIALTGGPLVPRLLNSAAIRQSLRQRAPLVFLNACRTTGVAPEYTRMMGWAQQFMAAGAGALIGTMWAIRSDSAATFAHHFYQALLGKKTLGQATLQARKALRDPVDPSWLAYTVYGDPDASIADLQYE